jgi:hypothetical protein
MLLFLAVVTDVFDRPVADWLIASHLRRELVLNGLAMALAKAKRRPDGVIHHSDQGTQYISIALGKRCREAGAHADVVAVLLSSGTVGTGTIELGEPAGGSQLVPRQAVLAGLDQATKRPS